MNLPFKEYKQKDFIVREFSDDVDDLELVWHRDRENRLIEVVENKDWYFQFDNELPFLLKEFLYIEKGRYHRVIKGTSNLKIKIYYV